MIDLNRIPPLRGPRPAWTSRIRRRAPDNPDLAHSTSRRFLLRGAIAAGATAGLAGLAVFPAARPAFAAGFRLFSRYGTYYQIYGSCPPYARSHDCSPGCGPSLVCPDCCRETGQFTGFHHTSRTKDGYRLRPDECHGTYDGWLWRYAARCGRCAGGVLWRCHDGWKRSGSGHWYKTICRWAMECRQ